MRCAASSSEQGERYSGRSRDGKLVALDELGAAIAYRVRPGDDGQAFAMSPQVFGKLFDRRISSPRILAQSHQDNVVQVAGEPSCEAPGVFASGGADALGAKGHGVGTVVRRTGDRIADGSAGPPQTDTEREVLDIIRAHPGGIVGKQILKTMKNKSRDIEQPTLTRHIIPTLRQHHRAKNRRGGVGYYIDSETWRALARIRAALALHTPPRSKPTLWV